MSEHAVRKPLGKFALVAANLAWHMLTYISEALKFACDGTLRFTTSGQSGESKRSSLAVFHSGTITRRLFQDYPRASLPSIYSTTMSSIRTFKRSIVQIGSSLF